MIKSTKEFKLSEYTAHYYEAGEGRPLIFLHGFMGDCYVWDSLIPLLSNNYRCICLDLLGFGNSSMPDIAYTIANEVRFVDEFIQRLNLEDYTLIGHSFGGWVSSYFSIYRPSSHLNSIVLLAPAGIRDDDFKGSYKYFIPLLLPNKFIDLALNLISPFLSLLGFKSQVKKFKKIRGTFHNKSVASSFLLRQFKDKNPKPETVDHLLQELDLPVLIISGEIDNVIPLWHAQTYANQIKNSHSLFIPDASHDLVDTHPELIASKILEIIPATSEVHR